MLQTDIFFFLQETNYRILKKRLIREWVKKTIVSENNRVGEINIILCSDDYLYQMNFGYLKHDTLTDIITFDYTENNTVSGELFISINRIKDNSRIYSKSIKDELHRVIIHGILHLCGYDDKNDSLKQEMTLKENYYLSRRPDELAVT